MWPQFVPGYDINLLKSYSLETISAAFQDIAGSSGIDFCYRQGGCQQRAQLMSMILAKRFIVEHSKIWLFAPAALSAFDNRAMFIEDENKLSPFNIISWTYHVAPAVQVCEKDQVNTYVIDPSVNAIMPVNLNTWFNAIGNSTVCRYSFHQPVDYFFNRLCNKSGELTGIFDGSFFPYDEADRNNLTLEKGLAVNDTAMFVYRKYILPMMKGNNANDAPMLEDLKSIFGDASTLDMLFAQNVSGNTSNTSHRYVLSLYTDIMLDAKAIFNTRLAYWVKYVSALL